MQARITTEPGIREFASVTRICIVLVHQFRPRILAASPYAINNVELCIAEAYWIGN